MANAYRFRRSQLIHLKGSVQMLLNVKSMHIELNWIILKVLCRRRKK